MHESVLRVKRHRRDIVALQATEEGKNVDANTIFLMPWRTQECDGWFIAGDYTFYNLVLMTIVSMVFLARLVNPVYKFLALALE